MLGQDFDEKYMRSSTARERHKGRCIRRDRERRKRKKGSELIADDDLTPDKKRKRPHGDARCGG